MDDTLMERIFGPRPRPACASCGMGTTEGLSASLRRKQVPVCSQCMANPRLVDSGVLKQYENGQREVQRTGQWYTDANGNPSRDEGSRMIAVAELKEYPFADIVIAPIHRLSVIFGLDYPTVELANYIDKAKPSTTVYADRPNAESMTTATEPWSWLRVANMRANFEIATRRPSFFVAPDGYCFGPCRRSQAPADIKWVPAPDGGRLAWCEPCADAVHEAFALSSPGHVFSAADITLADAAGVRARAGLARDWGVRPELAAGAVEPFAYVDLDAIRAGELAEAAKHHVEPVVRASAMRIAS